MFSRKNLLCALIIFFALGGFLWAGDTAVFADLGFSPDGKTYMFAQYGVQSGGLKPWADLFVVDVARNNFVSGGKVSYIHDVPATAGQDGSGALYHLISRNAALAERNKVNFLYQGRPLYIALNGLIGDLSLELPENLSEGKIEFRDFETGAQYRAALVSTVTGSGDSLASSFHINLDRTAKDGSFKTYTVGTPGLKRPGVASYRIRKVISAPLDGSMILVIEMKKRNGADFDIRYMVEALKL